MSERRPPPVPAIPPLSGIQDPNARAVLQALVDGWQVRNNGRGSGEQRFLTEADLPEAFTKVIRQSLASGATPTPGGAPIGGGGGVAGVIQGITDAIRESWVWKTLDQRIAWIERPAWINEKLSQVTASFARAISFLGAKVDSNAAAIAQEETVRVTNERAVATAVRTILAQYGVNVGEIVAMDEVIAELASVSMSRTTTLQSSVNGLTASLQTTSSLVNSLDAGVRAMWSLQVDAYGYVAGMAFGVQGRPGYTTSDFIVRADRIAFGAPNGGTYIPFVVLTTTDADGNPPGVYIQDAFIQNATIDVLKISGGALGAPVLYSASDVKINGGTAGTPTTWEPLFRKTLTGQYGGGVVATLTFTMDNSTTAMGEVDAFGEVELAIYRGGVVQSTTYQKFGVRSSGGDVQVQLPVSATVAKDFATSTTPFPVVIEAKVRSIPNPASGAYVKAFTVRDAKLMVHGVRR